MVASYDRKPTGSPSGWWRRRAATTAGMRGRAMDRLADPQVRGAAAEIAVHGRVDIRVGGLGCLGQQRGGGHDLARLTVAALRHVELFPRALQGCVPSGERPSIVVTSAPCTRGDRRVEQRARRDAA